MNTYTILKKPAGSDFWSQIPALSIDCALWSDPRGISAKARLCYDKTALYVRLSAVEAQISPVRTAVWNFSSAPCRETTATLISSLTLTAASTWAWPPTAMTWCGSCPRRRCLPRRPDAPRRAGLSPTRFPSPLSGISFQASRPSPAAPSGPTALNAGILPPILTSSPGIPWLLPRRTFTDPRILGSCILPETECHRSRMPQIKNARRRGSFSRQTWRFKRFFSYVYSFLAPAHIRPARFRRTSIMGAASKIISIFARSPGIKGSTPAPRAARKCIPAT